MQRVPRFGSYRTAWAWLQKLRKATVFPGHDRLRGKIGADETPVGAAKSGKRGRGAAGETLVLIAVENDGRRFWRIRLRCNPDASAHSLETAVKEMASPGAMVCTAGCKGYSGLGSSVYVHEVFLLYPTRGSFFERPRWIQAVSLESFFENRMIFSITYT